MAVAALAAVLAVPACGGDDDDGAAAAGQPASSESSATRGGSLTILEPSGLASLDFFQTIASSGMGTGGNVFYAIYGALLTVNADGTLEMGQLESIESDDEGAVWTLTLRPDMTFTDGTPFDAEALKWNFENYANPDNRSNGFASASEIESMRVVDPVTLELTLQEPNGAFDRHIARNLVYVASPTAVQELGDDFGANPVGAGPFEVAEFQRETSVRLVRNEDYWDSERPYVDEITFRAVPDPQQRLNSIVNGEADAAFALPVPTVADAEGQGLQTAAILPAGGLALFMNVEQEPLDDPRVRRALSLMFDRDRYDDVVNEGNGQPVHTLFPEGHELYNDVELSAYDPDEAQRLIDEYVEEKGGPIRINVISTDSATSRPAPEFLQAAAADLDNIEITVEAMPTAELVEVLGSGNYQVANSAAYGIDVEPTIYANMHSDFIGVRNFSRYSSAELDDLLARGRTSDVAARQAAYEEVSELLAEEMPILFYSRYLLAGVAGERVGGLEPAMSEYFARADLLYVQEG